MTRQTYFMLEVASNTVAKDNIERYQMQKSIKVGL